MINKVLFLGAPGSGKGTQAKNLQRKYGFEHISTGDILRKHVKDKSELGQRAKAFMDAGDLVPDTIINQMMVETLKEKGDRKYILDGYPRTLNQAEFLDGEGLNLDAVIYFDVSLVAVLDRMAGRLTAPKSGESYHVKYKPPRVRGKCDVSGEDLVIREDDKPETVKKRYTTYLNQTQPLLEYYKKKNIVQEINAEQTIDKIQSATEAIVA